MGIIITYFVCVSFAWKPQIYPRYQRKIWMNSISSHDGTSPLSIVSRNLQVEQRLFISKVLSKFSLEIADSTKSAGPDKVFLYDLKDIKSISANVLQVYLFIMQSYHSMHHSFVQLNLLYVPLD